MDNHYSNKLEKNTNNTKGVRIFILGMILIGVLIPITTILIPDIQRERLLKNGIRAEAEIISVEDTGSRYNDQPEVRLVLKVNPETSTPYSTETVMYISPVYIPQFQPGKKVVIRHDPDDKMKVAVEEVVN